jgi:hypothetical protein
VGAVLRLRKSFETTTSPVRAAETQFTDDPGTAGDVQTFRDSLNSIVVPNGHVEWHVNPSTRPAVMERKVYDFAPEPTRQWSQDGTPPPQGTSVDVPFTLAPDDAGGRFDIGLTWDTPDDLDLEVYRVENGKLTPVASSGNPPLMDESVSIEDAAAGDYVLRVINYQSSATTYTLTAATFPVTVTDVHPATAPYETWTLSCERPDGTVLQQVNVLVSRGDRVEIDLAACRAAWAA